MVVTKFNYRPFIGHDFSSTVSRTEKKGYIPARKQIENLILEGKKLDAYRSGRYLYNANSFENLTAVDMASLQMPFYSDELSLAEKSAYYAGVKQAYLDKLSKLSTDKTRADESKKIEDSFKSFLESVKSSFSVSKEGEPDGTVPVPSGNGKV